MRFQTVRYSWVFQVYHLSSYAQSLHHRLMTHRLTFSMEVWQGISRED